MAIDAIDEIRAFCSVNDNGVLTGYGDSDQAKMVIWKINDVGKQRKTFSFINV